MSSMFFIGGTLSKLGQSIGLAFQLKNIYFGGPLIDHDEFRARMTMTLFGQNAMAPEVSILHLQHNTAAKMSLCHSGAERGIELDPRTGPKQLP